jgi:predicted MFS family arabinose efflux permease
MNRQANLHQQDRRPLRLGRKGGFAAVALAFAVAMVGTTLPTPLYTLYREKFGFSELTITVIFATYAVGVISALLLFGRLSDEIGRRRTLLPGLALSALSAVVFLVAQGLGLLLVGRVLSGLSAGIFTGTATATLVDLAPPGRQRLATLVATIANMGGLGCGPLLAGVLSQYFGSPLKLTFWVDLALLLPATVGVWAMPEPVEDLRRPRLQIQLPRVPEPMRPIFIRAALAAFAGFAVFGLFTAVAPAFLGQKLGVTNRAVVGLVVFAVFAASTAGQLMLEVIPEPAALPGGCVALIVGMVLLALSLAASSLALLVGAGVVAGFGQGLSFRAGLTTVNAQAPAQQRAEVASAFFVVAYVAISLPVIGVGALAQATGLRAAGLTFAAAVSALAVVVLILLARQGAATSSGQRAPA